MMEKPWIYKFAYKNIKSNYLYHDEVLKLLPRLLNKKGVINVGSSSNSIFKFARKTNKKVKLITFHQKSSDLKIPVNSSININKLRKILKS